MLSLADRCASLPDHPFYRERLQRLINVSDPIHVSEFIALLPQITEFFDLRFLHDCVCHVVDQLDECREHVPVKMWHTLYYFGLISCLSVDAVGKLLASATYWTETRGVAAPWLPGAWRRHAFQCDLVSSGLTQTPPIALGSECLPWTIPARWGFRTGTEGLQTYTPLSLAVHHPESVVQLLRDGPSSYAASGLRMMKSPNGILMLRRADGRILWNHHQGSHWQEDDFAFFRLRTSELIGSFDRMLSVPPFRPLNFVMQHRTDDLRAFAAVVDRIRRALAQRVAAPHTLTIINNAWREPNEVTLEPPDPDQPNVRIIFAPPPFPEYVWFLPPSYQSDVREAYEFSIVSALREAMSTAVSGSRTAMAASL